MLCLFNSASQGWRRPAALFAIGLPLLLLLACSKKEDDKQPSTTFGTPVVIGQGSARSYISLDAAGNPTEVGVRLADASLVGLPAMPAFGTMYDLTLPAAAAVKMPFDHISFGWNPNGHEPAGVYTVPHFDAHFYLQSMAVQHTITLDDPLGDNFPATAMLPADYVTPPNVVPGRTVPMMGRHWVDRLSPENTPGGAFSSTFIYGTFDGHVTFLEPMFTKALLVPGVSIEKPIRQPAAYEASGKYYPTTYAIGRDATTQEYVITLKNMVQR